LKEVDTKVKKSIEHNEFDDQLDLIADLYESEFGIEHQGPVIFGEAPEVVIGHLD
jgi:hypothetical protein